jgi:hypothetical protein
MHPDRPKFNVDYWLNDELYVVSNPCYRDSGGKDRYTISGEFETSETRSIYFTLALLK